MARRGGLETTSSVVGACKAQRPVAQQKINLIDVSTVYTMALL